MKISDPMLAAWLQKLKEFRANGYDPYNGIGDLKVGKISISWRP